MSWTWDDVQAEIASNMRCEIEECKEETYGALRKIGFRLKFHASAGRVIACRAGEILEIHLNDYEVPVKILNCKPETAAEIDAAGCKLFGLGNKTYEV